ncbi:hypothetical protein C8R45DRAFT_277226 [Mycena sanguinolenta]|nr:hypothetical protein C8R45DRAFT_277226 [Mycena sanguinolenta]
MSICDRFRFQDPLVQDGPWVREQMCHYVALVVRGGSDIFLFQAVADLALCPVLCFALRRRRLCVLSEYRPILPSVNSMWWMLCLVQKYGFEGDDIDLLREERLRRLLIVYQRARDSLADVIICYPRVVEGHQCSDHPVIGQGHLPPPINAVAVSPQNQVDVSMEGNGEVDEDLWDISFGV